MIERGGGPLNCFDADCPVRPVEERSAQDIYRPEENMFDPALIEPADAPSTATRLHQPVTTTPQWLATIIALLLLSQVALCFISAGRSLAGKVDLRAFYAAGTIVRSGHAAQLYDYEYQQRVQNEVVGPRAGALPFLYPPFAALLFIPLSLVSYRAAFMVLFLLNVGLLLVTARLLSPWLPALVGRSRFLLPSLYGCLFTGSVALMQGQISFILLLVYSGGYVLHLRKHNLLAGLLLSICLAKFQIALPVVLLFVIWREWRLVTGFLVGAVGVITASFAIVGRAGMMSYWHSLFGMASSTALNAVAGKARYGMFPTDMPNLHGITFGLSHGLLWGVLLNVVLSCLVLGWAARQKASILVALPAAMLVSYHMQPHDLTLLLLPLSFACNGMILKRKATKARVIADIPQRYAQVGLVSAVLLLVLPLAGVLMVNDYGYLTSVAVALTMTSVVFCYSHIAADTNDSAAPGVSLFIPLVPC